MDNRRNFNRVGARTQRADERERSVKIEPGAGFWMHGPAKTLEIELLGPFRQSGSHYDLPKKAQALLA